MSTPGNIPSKNPSDQSSMPGVFGAVHKKQMQAIQGQLPCRVIGVAGTRVTVQPMISILTTSGQAVERSPVVNVPRLALGSGGFMLYFPVAVGDMGWIMASDRDISLFLQNMQIAVPNTARLHSFEDGRFVPDTFATGSAMDASACSLQTLNGEAGISITPEEISLKVGALFFTLSASGIATNAPMSVPEGSTIGGVPFGTHGHDGVQTGSGTSGGPVEL